MVLSVRHDRPRGESRAGAGAGLEAPGGPRYYAGVMHRSRVSRSVAVLMATLVAFQFGVVGMGMACTMPERGMAMGMGHAGPSAVTRGGHPPVAGHSTTDPRMGGMPQRMPCDQQRSVPMCQAMGPCITALAAAPVDMGAAYHPPSRAVAMVVLTPPLPTFPPELPPPRA